MKILGIGNALLDILLMLKSDETLSELGMEKGAMDLIDERRMQEIHRAQAGLERSEAPGGSVCNTIRTLAGLGATAGYVGKVGSDEAGRLYEQAVRQAGVTTWFVRTEGISGCSTVFVSPDGERTMATFLGPAATLSADEILDDTLRKYDCVYVEGYLISNEALFLPILRRIRRLGLKIAVNLSNFNVVDSFIDLWRRVIPEYVDILFANESEAKSYTGLNAADAVREMSKQVDIAVVTIGEKGALAGNGDTQVHVPAPKCRVIDTTGAGDNFAGGFLYGLSTGASLEQSVHIGSLLSGYAIEIIGPHIPAGLWDEIKLKVNTHVGR
ncbi:MAG: adenosine kinase [Tannerella sp.]|jgi:sugar/nucleoside kinase (ribokinase family)|nr:adenosine kinase [Tannerella sp.]